MPQPTAGDVHVNQPLTNISIAYMQELKNFIAHQVFPIVPVKKQSDRYYTYDRSYWFRSEAKKRAPGEESAGAGWKVDNTPTYFCDPIAVHKDIDDQIRANADAMIDMDRDATEFVTQQLMLKREIDWSAAFFTTGLWTGSSTGTDIVPGNKWEGSSGTPYLDIRGEMKAVKKKTGKEPNVLILGEDVDLGLADSPDIIDRIKTTMPGQPADVTLQLLASLLRLDKVLVAGAVKNTAAEGLAASYDWVFNAKDALLLYVEPRPSLLKPSAGYCFSWTGYHGAGPAGQRIKRFRMEHLASDRIEGEIAFANKLVAAELGVYFDGAVT